MAEALYQRHQYMDVFNFDSRNQQGSLQRIRAGCTFQAEGKPVNIQGTLLRL